MAAEHFDILPPVDRYDVDQCIALIRRHGADHLAVVEQAFNSLAEDWIDGWYADGVLHLVAGPRLLDLCSDLIGYQP